MENHQQPQIRDEMDQEGNVNPNNRKWMKNPRKRLYMIIAGSIVFIFLVLIVAYIATQGPPPKPKYVPNPFAKLPPSESILQTFKKAAVCTDAVVCSEVGRDILAKNGSAMDAAIAALFCNGVVNCQSMGLGGGFLMTVYQRDTQEAFTLNAREAAPSGVTEEMYNENPKLTKSGPLAVAVPGELMGYWEAHKRFGRLSWSDVIMPTIKICREGYKMTLHQSDSIKLKENVIIKDPYLKSVFINPSTGKFYEEGTLIKNTKLCDTLQEIAESGGDSMYKGNLGRNLAKDILDMGGKVTEQDLADYKVRWEKPMVAKLRGGNTLYSVPPPGSGALLALIMNILDDYHFNSDSVKTDEATINTYHRITEAFKFALAHRGELGDTAFVSISELLNNLTSKEFALEVTKKIDDQKTSQEPEYYGAIKVATEDHGTAHISVLASNGDAVSVTSSVNFYFGAGIASKSTGIILNSGIDDFSFPKFANAFGLPPSEANRIAPGKKSQSSMTPTIVTDENGDVRLVIGASGGSKILTATALVTMRHLWFGESIKEAVDAPRIHHQLFPMELSYEYGITHQVIDGLEKLGHKTDRYRERGSIICAIAKSNGTIYANADFRKGGEVFGLD
ncbi:scoloptoxin SSD14 isoform X4 [Neocloeon triangulifer]|uniref:scoloptoxin SSD14 isoform X4 n=2 Tax=Neocloeon triangulifer TaxID=2078957 RepID=UPI00286F5A6E|nr:scoloptoxin SSD14 isoform X4 [Neocloeon triangulifer]